MTKKPIVINGPEIPEEEPEFPFWKIAANSTLFDKKIAAKMLSAYDKAEQTASSKIKANKAAGEKWYHDVSNSESLAEDLFMQSLTEEEASSPFCRMLMTFGPVLHWNDLADVCFWVLGVNSVDNDEQWSKWWEIKKNEYPEL